MVLQHGCPAAAVHRIINLKHTSILSLQARKLRSELAQLNLPADTLWVTSPLSRAIETLLLGCPTAHLLRQAPGGGGAAGSSAPSASTASASTENSAAVPNGGSDQLPRIMVLPCISEKVGGCWGLAGGGRGVGAVVCVCCTPWSSSRACVHSCYVSQQIAFRPTRRVVTALPSSSRAAQVVTCGDIGHPASVLCKRFPELAEPLGTLPELWWYTGKPDKPNCALQKRFESHETKHQVDVRVAGGCVVVLRVCVWMASADVCLCTLMAAVNIIHRGQRCTACRAACWRAGGLRCLIAAVPAALSHCRCGSAPSASGCRNGPKPRLWRWGTAATGAGVLLGMPLHLECGFTAMWRCSVLWLSAFGARSRRCTNLPAESCPALARFWPRSFEEKCKGVKPERMRNCEFRCILF